MSTLVFMPPDGSGGVWLAHLLARHPAPSITSTITRLSSCFALGCRHPDNGRVPAPLSHIRLCVVPLSCICYLCPIHVFVYNLQIITDHLYPICFMVFHLFLILVSEIGMIYYCHTTSLYISGVPIYKYCMFIHRNYNVKEFQMCKVYLYNSN